VLGVMLGKGAALPEGCELTSGDPNGRVVRATYTCAAGPVVVARTPRVGGNRQGLCPAFGQHGTGCREHRLLFVHARQLPDAKSGEQRDDQHRQHPQDHSIAANPDRHRDCDNCQRAHDGPIADGLPMNGSLKTLLIVAFLILILWNLGAGLYYMLVDKGTTKRTVNALTRRIALSVALILFVALAIYMGWITPHGIGRAP